MNYNFNFTKEGNGDTVLFLHGWGCDGTVWHGLIAQLKDRFTCVTVDFFADVAPLGGLSPSDYADMLAKLIIDQRLAPVHIVGHSYGGRVALVLAANYPQLIAKVALISSAGLRRFSLKRTAKIFAYKVAKIAVKTKLVDEKILSKFGSVDFRSLTRGLRATFRLAVTTSQGKYARLVDKPTLLIWGKADEQTPLWMARKFKRIIKGSALIVMPDCGHFCFLERGQLTAAILKEFLLE